MRKMLFGFIFLAIGSVAAQAGCQCMCVNNEKQWVCSNSYDVPMGYCGGYCYGNKSEGSSFDLSKSEKLSKSIVLASLSNKKDLTTKIK